MISLRQKRNVLPAKWKRTVNAVIQKNVQLNLGQSIGFVGCNNPNHTVPLHFECFHHLIKSKCNGNFLFEKDNNVIELIRIACGKQC